MSCRIFHPNFSDKTRPVDQEKAKRASEGDSIFLCLWAVSGHSSSCWVLYLYSSTSSLAVLLV